MGLTKILDYEFGRFLLVGASTVFIDLVFYLTFLYAGFDTYVSKGISFSIGTIFAYFANQNFTFKSAKTGAVRFIVFTLLYLSTLLINVISNEFVLSSTAFIINLKVSIMVSFLVATSISASLNFLGMKYMVFKVKKD